MGFSGLRSWICPQEKADAAALDMAAVLILLVVSGVYLAGLASHGIYWDEYAQALYGRSVLDWYSSGFTDRGYLELGNLYRYGGLVEASLEAVAAVIPGDPYLIRHGLVSVLAVAGLWGTWRLGVAVGDRSLGVVAMVLLAASPRYLGHGFFNSKDIPTAAFFVLGLGLFSRDLGRPLGSPLRKVVPAGFVLGLLLGTRPGAAFVLPSVLLGYVARWWHEGRTRAALVLLVARFGVAAFVAWPVMLVAWPWGLERPLVHPLAVVLRSSRFRFLNAELFQGRFISTYHMPLDYVPVWLLRTLPEVTLIGVGIAAFILILRIRGRWGWRPDTLLVASAGLFPLAFVMLSRAPLYDGIRHLLFLQPLIAIAAAFGILAVVRFACRRGWALSVATGLTVAVGLGLPLAEMSRMAPYEYVYFNRLSGGLPAASGRFELDYWGLSYKEGVERLSEMEPRTDVRVASCSYPGPVEESIAGRFEYVGSYAFEVSAEPDHLLMTAPHDCALGWPPVLEPPITGEAVPLVARQGVPLLYLVSSPEGGDLPLGR